MANTTYARRYAQAALDLGLEHSDLDTWRKDLNLLASLWSDADLRAYLEDVRISKQARLQRCRERLGAHLSPRALNMVLLLISRGRTSLIPYIARHFEDLERQRDQTVVAQVRSAAPLTPEQAAALKQQLTKQVGKEVELQVQPPDPTLLGGLIVRVGDELLDLSLIGRLNRLRDQVVGRHHTNGS